MSNRITGLIAATSLILATTSAFAFPVNTYTTASQAAADVSVDDTGSFIVVWSSDDQDGDSGGVFAQRYDSSGAQLGAEFQVNDRTTGNQMRPRVSMAPNGSFVVTWEDLHISSILARQYDSLGVPAGTSFAVNGLGHGFLRAANVAHDGAGNFTVAWVTDSPTGDSSEVFARRYDSTANPLGNEFQVNTYTPWAQGGNSPPAITAAPDGTVTILWHSQSQDDGNIGSSTGGGVYGQRYDSAGSPIGGEFQVNVATAGGQGGDGIDIGSDSSGNLVAVWNENNEGPPFLVPGGNIVARRFNSAGTPLGSEFTVNTRLAGGQHTPKVAVDGGGSFLIAYSGYDGNDRGVAAQRFASDGSPVGVEFPLNNETVGLQAVGGLDANPAGHFVGAWEGDDGSAGGVFGRRFESSQPTCPAAPVSTCREAGRSVLLLKTAGSGKLVWKWKKGAPYDGEELGNPDAGLTSYAFCLYRENGTTDLLYDVGIAGDGICETEPCWSRRPVGPKYTYKDKKGTSSDGIVRLRLRGSPSNRGKLQLLGKGAFLSLPALPLGPFSTLTAQLINGNGECWQTSYSEARVDSATLFKAR